MHMTDKLTQMHPSQVESYSLRLSGMIEMLALIYHGSIRLPLTAPIFPGLESYVDGPLHLLKAK
jgi:hypothetical protein